VEIGCNASLRLQVSSCFSQLLNLHNLSEEISSAQLERAVRIGEVNTLQENLTPLWQHMSAQTFPWRPCLSQLYCHVQVEQSTRSTNRSFKRLIRVNGVKPEQIYEAITSQTVELVFTAHPTQARHAAASHPSCDCQCQSPSRAWELAALCTVP
jgi:phosphoenolpyruvate carboxylase